VVPHYSFRPAIRDPDDELLVDAAINGHADAIVSFNASDFKPADPRQHELGILVCAPGEILRRLTWRPTAATLSAFRPL
jgi:predicted nucleic acid-binding protein